jgi:hypothetical protein
VARIARVEEVVNAMAGEIERLAESQRTTARLLAEGLPARRVAGEPQRVITPI